MKQVGRPGTALVLSAMLALILLLIPSGIGVNAGSDGPSIPAIAPVRLRVPAAGINATVQWVGTTDDGSMDVPSNFSDVAWFSPGFRPGDYGSAVFDGHVSNVDSEAVFFYVEDLKTGGQRDGDGR